MIEAHRDAVSAIRIDRLRNRVITASWDSTLKVWEPGTWRNTCEIRPSTRSIEDFALDCDTAYIASSNGRIEACEIAAGCHRRILRENGVEVLSLALPRRGDLLLLGTARGDLEFLPLTESVDLPPSASAHIGSITSIALRPASDVAVTGSRDGFLKAWDTTTLSTVATISAHDMSIYSIDISCDGLVASASQDGRVRVWNLDSRSLLQTFDAHANGVTGVAFSPDGLHLASVSLDETLRIWSTATGKQQSVWPGETAFRCCAWLDIQTLIAGDWAGRLRTFAIEY